MKVATAESLESIRKKYPKRLTRGRAIKLYCKEACCCGDLKSWRECTLTGCFLYNFRLGRETLEEGKTIRKKSSMLSKNEVEGA